MSHIRKRVTQDEIVAAAKDAWSAWARAMYVLYGLRAYRPEEK